MRALLLVCLLTATAHANTTVYLERHGQDDMPRFGGGDRAWSAIVGCVQRHYAPFAVDVTDRRPAKGPFITAVVGGLASQKGLDDDTTNGVGPYDGTVIRDAVVHVFSQVGTGERDIENLCAVTAHEVGHALGLDHEVLCGDIMSYYLDQCGPRTFVDREAPCGETEARTCGNDDETQSSYGRLVALVGLRKDPVPAQVDPDPEPAAEPDAEPEVAPAPEPEPEVEAEVDAAPQRAQPCHQHHRRHHPHDRRYVDE